MYNSSRYLKQKTPTQPLSHFLTICVFSSVIQLPGKIQVSLQNVAGGTRAETYVSQLIYIFICQ